KRAQGGIEQAATEGTHADKPGGVLGTAERGVRPRDASIEFRGNDRLQASRDTEDRGTGPAQERLTAVEPRGPGGQDGTPTNRRPISGAAEENACQGDAGGWENGCDVARRQIGQELAEPRGDGISQGQSEPAKDELQPVRRGRQQTKLC